MSKLHVQKDISADACFMDECVLISNMINADFCGQTGCKNLPDLYYIKLKATRILQFM